MIKIERAVYEQIKDHAQSKVPVEACGYLGGRNNTVSHFFPMTNIDQSETHFSLDPREQFKVLKEARSRGIELIAVYHSHPATPPRMSEEDIRLANDPGIIYVIYSIAEDRARAFKINGNKTVNAVELEVSDGLL